MANTKRKSEAAFLAPKRVYVSKSSNAGQDSIQISGRIKKILFPKETKNHEGWSIVDINGCYIVAGSFPFLDEFFVYNLKCVRDITPNPYGNTEKYKLLKFMDPPYEPVPLDTIVLTQMMLVILGMHRQNVFRKIKKLRQHLKLMKKDDKNIDPEWLLSSYDKKWLRELEERSFVFKYQQVLKLSKVWTNRVLKRLSLNDLKDIVEQMKKDPIVFCFGWKHRFNTPEISTDILKLCIRLFNANIEHHAISVVSSVKTELYTHRRITGNISFKTELLNEHKIDKQYCIKNDILKPVYIEKIDGPRWFLYGDFNAMEECSIILKRIFNTATTGILERTNSLKKPINGVTMTKTQEKIFELVDYYNLLIVLGSAGTGKTKLGEFIFKSFKKGTVLPLAFYGRIAANLRKTYGSGMTIHRLKAEILNGTTRGQKLAENIRVIIIDEVSIITLHLFRDALVLLPNLCKIIMLGDAKQMPPPMAGNIIGAFLAKYGATKIVNELKTILRVDPSKQKLLENFSKIRNGLSNLSVGYNIESDEPFIVLNRSRISSLLDSISRTDERITILQKDFLPIMKKYPNPDEFQIMTQKNSVRQDIVRAIFEIKKNDKTTQFKRGTFYVGEKIMFLDNYYGSKLSKNYLKCDPVMNGEIVTIKKIYDVDPGVEDTNLKNEVDIPKLSVNCTADEKKNKEWDRILYLDDDRQVNLTLYPLSSIDKGSAATVASCQGSEYPVSVFYIHDRFSHTLKKEELYTAVTRAKNRVIVICDIGTGDDLKKSDIAKIIANPYQHPEYVFSHWLPDIPEPLCKW